MPSSFGSVGALELPVAAGTQNQRVADPAIDVLLAYVAHWLNEGLNARLAQHTGLKRGTTVCTAVPTGRTYAFDPTDPQAEKFRLDPPCLFMWWSEQSRLASKEELPASVLYPIRSRMLRMLWMMPELPSTDQYVLRAGLFSAADAILHIASERGRHRTFSYTDAAGKTWPTGTPAAECVAELGTFDWEYIGGAPTRWGLNDQDPTSPDISPSCTRDWPCLVASFRVYEKLGPETMLDPDDVTRDILAGIWGSVESLETIHMMDRVLDAPDGSELEGDELDEDG